MPLPSASRLPACLPLVLLLLQGCGGCRPQPAGWEVASVTTPVAARLEVGYSRRELMPWTPGLALSVGQSSVGVPCPRTPDQASDQVPAAGTAGLLQLDPAGDRLAARCGRDQPWTIAYRGGSLLVGDCQTQPAGELQWEQVPALGDRFPALLACPDANFFHLQKVAQGAGPALVTRLVEASARGHHQPRLGIHPEFRLEWVKAYRALPAADQERLFRPLREELLAGKLSPQELDRLALLLDPADAALTPEVLRRLLGGHLDLRDPTSGRAALLRRYALADPPGASALVCPRATDLFQLGALGLAVLAHGKVPCPALTELHQKNSCAMLAGGRTCPGNHPCTPQEHQAEVEAELKVPPGQAYGPDALGHATRLTTAAAVATGVPCASP